MERRRRVVVVGAGFAGLELVKGLAAAPVDVVLVDANNFHTFQPLLYQVATAGLDGDDIAAPVRAVVRSQANVDVRLGQVVDIDVDDRRVVFRDGPALSYDRLVLAAGAVTNTYGVPGVDEHGFGLKSLEDALQLRQHLLRQCERASVDPPLVEQGVLDVGEPVGQVHQGGLGRVGGPVEHRLAGEERPDRHAVDPADELVVLEKGKKWADRGDAKVHVGEQGHGTAKTELKAKGDGFEIVKNPESGGSLTALPIIETQAGDVSAYIPTNVISITDGQIFLETDLFNAGIRPAINAGISVSRVGGAAQTKLIKNLSGGIRTDLAQYRELAAFAQFASDLDEATRKQLDRGARVTELLKQAQYSPLSISLMGATLFAVNKGFLDDIDVKKVLAFEHGLHQFLKTSHAALLAKLEKDKAMDKDAEAELTAAIGAFKKRMIALQEYTGQMPWPDTGAGVGTNVLAALRYWNSVRKK